MALEGAVAKYTVQIVQDGTTAPAVQEFNNLRKAAQDAAGGTATATSGLRELRETSMLTHEAVRVLSTSAAMCGGSLGEIGRGALIASESMRALRTGAMLTGASLSEIGLVALPAIAAILPTVIAGWGAWKAHLDEVNSANALANQQIELLAKNSRTLEQAQKDGLISAGDYIKVWSQIVNNDLRGSADSLRALGLSANSVADYENLLALENKMHLTTMDHMQQQQAKAWEVYQARMKEIQSLTTHGGISTAEGAKAESGAMAEYNSTMAGIGSAQQAKAYSEAKKTIEDDLFLYEQQLAGKRKLTADDEFTYRYDKMHALAKSEEITWDDLTQYLIEEDRRRVAASAQADAEMARAKKASLDEVVRQENQLHALEQKIDLDQFAGEARKQQAIKQTTQAQIEQFTKLAQALGMTQQEIDAWVAKIKSGAVIQSQAVNDGANHIKEWQQIAGEAEQQFAAGFASAFISFADGTKTAGQAFEQFAASFMEQVAQMILQMLILRAISGIFGGAAGGAGGAGGGGAVSGTMMAAGGGVFAPRMMADGGFAGMFSSPTYFPRFNVVGGEAGTEMLAALARPTFRSLGGIDAIVGNAGSSRLALTNADALGGRGGAGGMIHIRIEHTPETQATIVQNSIKGAVSQVTQELKRNSALSSAVKTLTQ